MSGRVVVEDLRFNPETGLYRREDGVEFALVHDVERDLWISNYGAEYVQNLNRLASPVYIRIDDAVWKVRHLGSTNGVNWSIVALPEPLKSELKVVLRERLRELAPSEISKMNRLCSVMPDVGRRVVDLGLV